MAKVLIIDDEDLFREDFASILRQEGCKCRTAPDGEKGLVLAEEFDPDVIFCDIVMPGRSGVEILDDMVRICPESCIIMITAYATLETAVEAFRKGVSDYITKQPLLMEDVFQKIDRFMEHRQLTQEVKFLRRELSQDAESLKMVGQSDAMKTVLELIEKVAPTRSTVLIGGESGTGKELIARAIHNMSGSQEQPFIAINCAGIPEHLMESEFFGHVRGAFTSAIKDRSGFFELAGEGTIFLDEIAEMPLTLQTRLLRVLEEREFFPVGGARLIPLKARVIASTNRNLREFMNAGRFREDLFFRLAIFEINSPPLRERRSDIPLLVEYFVKKLNNELKRQCRGADNEAIRHLLLYTWPGNVRELRNVIERAMILGQGNRITAADLHPEITNLSQPSQYSDDLRDALHAYEREHIRRVLMHTDGNREEAARRLGINSSTLYRKMTELSISE